MKTKATVIKVPLPTTSSRAALEVVMTLYGNFL